MLGNKIRELRKEAKYTQEELAQLLRSKYGLGTDRAMKVNGKQVFKNHKSTH